MSLLNREADGSPNVLIALFRALLAFGPMTEASLIDLVAPEPVIKQNAAKKTLYRWKQLGFFVLADGSAVDVSAPIKAVGLKNPEGFRTEVSRLIFSESNNAMLLQEEPEEETSSPSGRSGSAADLCRALSWALMQDPFTFPRNFDASEVLLGQQGVFPRPFKNSTRWPSFQEWAVFLGMAVNSGSSGRNITPNPALALEGFLSEIRGTSSEMSQSDFLERAAALLPVIDNGSIRKRVEGTVTTSWIMLSPRDLSPSLSSALLTLEAGRKIRLELRSDAPAGVRNLLGRVGRPPRPFSHVAFTGSER